MSGSAAPYSVQEPRARTAEATGPVTVRLGRMERHRQQVRPALPHLGFAATPARARVPAYRQDSDGTTKAWNGHRKSPCRAALRLRLSNESKQMKGRATDGYG